MPEKVGAGALSPSGGCLGGMKESLSSSSSSLPSSSKRKNPPATVACSCYPVSLFFFSKYIYLLTLTCQCVTGGLFSTQGVDVCQSCKCDAFLFTSVPSGHSGRVNELLLEERVAVTMEQWADNSVEFTLANRTAAVSFVAHTIALLVEFSPGNKTNKRNIKRGCVMCLKAFPFIMEK